MPTMPKTFRSPHVPDRKERGREYEQRRGSARERGYTSKWDKASKGFLRRNPICKACEAAGVICASEVTDHIVPHRRDSALFWDRSNWQACCRWHHDVVKQRLERDYEQGRAVAADLDLSSPKALALAEALRL